MSVQGVNELVDRLRERGLVAAEAPMPGNDAADRPWFVSLLLGVAGWLAGIFLLVFVGMLFDLNKSSAILFTGLVLLGAAWGIYFADRNAVFFDQLALALSIAGQIAITWGIVHDNESSLAFAVTLLALQIVVLVVMPNRVARTLAALFAVIAWVYTIRALRAPDLDELVFMERQGTHSLGAYSLPLEWAITWIPLLVLAIWLIRRESVWMASGMREFARPVLTGVLLGLSIGGFVATPVLGGFLLGGQAPGLGMGFDWRALFALLSIGLALCAAYGAFRLRSTGLLGFAILASLLHLARFYYMYGTSLLAKALIMLCVGVLLLGLGEWLRRRQASQPA